MLCMAQGAGGTPVWEVGPLQRSSSKTSAAKASGEDTWSSQSDSEPCLKKASMVQAAACAALELRSTLQSPRMQNTRSKDGSAIRKVREGINRIKACSTDCPLCQHKAQEAHTGNKRE